LKRTASGAKNSAPGENVPVQFEVYKNPSAASAKSVPYVVVIQSDELRHLNTRLVAPLIAPKSMKFFPRLMPEVVVRNEKLVVDVTNLAALPVKLLDRRIGELSSHRDRIIQALDLVFTGV
jgi:toxin CcdB